MDLLEGGYLIHGSVEQVEAHLDAPPLPAGIVFEEYSYMEEIRAAFIKHQHLVVFIFNSQYVRYIYSHTNRAL